MLIKSEQLSVGSLIKNVMLKYLFWASYILRLCAQTCTPNRQALYYSEAGNWVAWSRSPGVRDIPSGRTCNNCSRA